MRAPPMLPQHATSHVSGSPAHQSCVPARLAQSGNRRLLRPQPGHGSRKGIGGHARKGRKEGRARLFRRPRHQRDPALAPDHLPLRGRHLHRRSRPGRGTRAGPPEGRNVRREGNLHRRSARDLRARFRLPDVPRQRALRRPVPARHLHRPSADRATPDRDRRTGRRRRGGARRNRQGQRPGPLRAQLLRAETRHQDHRPVARMGPHQPHQTAGVRRSQPDPHRQGQAWRGAVQRRCQPAAFVIGRKDPRRPRSGSRPDRLPAHHQPRGRARQGDGHRHRLRTRRSQWRSTASAFRPPRC